MENPKSERRNQKEKVITEAFMLFDWQVICGKCSGRTEMRSEQQSLRTNWKEHSNDYLPVTFEANVKTENVRERLFGILYDVHRLYNYCHVGTDPYDIYIRVSTELQYVYQTPPCLPPKMLVSTSNREPGSKWHDSLWEQKYKARLHHTSLCLTPIHTLTHTNIHAYRDVMWKAL